MCGRFNLRTDPHQLAEIFSLLRDPIWSPRYNIAPMQPILVVRQHADRSRTADLLRWGLVPGWAASLSVGSQMTVVKSETVATSRPFAPAFQQRRCIIPVSGFYEWEIIPGQKVKQPWHIFPSQATVFSFAGLWETWTTPDGTKVETCAILTTAANTFLSPLNDRMPVSLSPQAVNDWLNPDAKIEELQAMLTPCPEDWLAREKIGRLINSTRNDSADCLTPC
jgi:putative SOS response-associated peptidase YedK